MDYEKQIEQLNKEIKEAKEQGDRLEALNHIMKSAKAIVENPSLIKCIERGDDISLNFTTNEGINFSLKITPNEKR